IRHHLRRHARHPQADYRRAHHRNSRVRLRFWAMALPSRRALISAALAALLSAAFFTAHAQDAKPPQPKPQETAPQAAPPETPPQPAKPKVRTITAFIKLDRALYPQQIDETLAFLHIAKAAYEEAGYEVQTLRIATQPFPAYTQDLAPVEAFKFFRQLDHLAEADDFLISIGPAMQYAGDDPRWAELLANVLAPATHMNGSIAISGDDGIHWTAVQASARVMEFLAMHSPRSQANFRFAATSFVPPGTPFFPAAYNSGDDRQFAIGLQSANVIAEALAGTHDPAAAEKAIVEKLGAYA